MNYLKQYAKHHKSFRLAELCMNEIIACGYYWAFASIKKIYIKFNIDLNDTSQVKHTFLEYACSMGYDKLAEQIVREIRYTITGNEQFSKCPRAYDAYMELSKVGKITKSAK